MQLTSKKTREREALGLSMTSMIDVVFLLLIFFLVTTTFALPERQVRSTIQVQQDESAHSPSELEPAIVSVVEQGGEFFFQIGTLTTRDEAELVEFLRRFDNKADGAFVRVADDAPFDFAARAINACRYSGFAIVTYLPTGP